MCDIHTLTSVKSDTWQTHGRWSDVTYTRDTHHAHTHVRHRPACVCPVCPPHTHALTHTRDTDLHAFVDVLHPGPMAHHDMHPPHTHHARTHTHTRETRTCMRLLTSFIRVPWSTMICIPLTHTHKHSHTWDTHLHAFVDVLHPGPMAHHDMHPPHTHTHTHTRETRTCMRLLTSFIRVPWPTMICIPLTHTHTRTHTHETRTCMRLLTSFIRVPWPTMICTPLTHTRTHTHAPTHTHTHMRHAPACVCWRPSSGSRGPPWCASSPTQLSSAVARAPRLRAAPTGRHSSSSARSSHRNLRGSSPVTVRELSPVAVPV